MVTTTGELRELGRAQPAPAADRARLRFPATRSEQVLPLAGPPGTCVVLVCASREGAPTLADVQASFDRRPWPVIPGKTVVVMNADETVPRGDVLRGPGAYDAVGDVEDRVDKLRVDLRERFDFVAAVAFPIVEPR
jgi:hypothetical protein